MRQIIIHKYLLLFILFLIAFFYGDFGGQIMAETTDEKGANALFQLSLAIFAIVYLYLSKSTIKIPFKKLFYSYLVLIFILSFFRHNIIEDLRLFTSVAITQFIILFLASLMHKLRFIDSLLLLVVVFITILWICVFVHLRSVGIISFSERNNFHRLGGLYSFGITGSLAGLTAILSGIGFYLDKSFFRKMIFVFFIVNSLLFTLGTDLRNTLVASIVCLLYLFYMLSKRKIYMKFVFILSLMGILFIGYYYINHSQAAGDSQNDLGVREMIWAWSFDGIGKHPFIGYGKVNYFATNVKSMIFQEKLSDPHSSILDIILKFGLPASVLYFYFYSKLVINNYKNDRIFKGNLIVIPMFWVLSTMTGGSFFIGYGNFGSYIFGISIFGVFLHPQLFFKRNFKKLQFIEENQLKLECINK